MIRKTYILIIIITTMTNQNIQKKIEKLEKQKESTQEKIDSLKIELVILLLASLTSLFHYKIFLCVIHFL